MAVQFLTVEQHQDVLKRLVQLGKKRGSPVPIHADGEEYTSLMICFLLHSLSAAESILCLSTSLGNEWFPTTVGYVIVRPMFEIDVTAHFITKASRERARQYIEFGEVLNKRKTEACAKHRNSANAGWKDGMELLWQNHWASREAEVRKKFDAVSSRFTIRKSHGREDSLKTGQASASARWQRLLGMLKATMYFTVSFLLSRTAMFILRTVFFSQEQMVRFGHNGQTNLMSAMFLDTQQHFSHAI
jgi:hypothetical protein